MRTTVASWQGTLVAILVALMLWPAVACSSGDATRREPAGRSRPIATVTPADAGSGVTLEVELHHEGLIVLRSPTFR